MPRRGPGNRPTGSEGWEIQCCKVRYPAALYQGWAVGRGLSGGTALYCTITRYAYTAARTACIRGKIDTIRESMPGNSNSPQVPRRGPRMSPGTRSVSAKVPYSTRTDSRPAAYLYRSLQLTARPRTTPPVLAYAMTPLHGRSDDVPDYSKLTLTISVRPCPVRLRQVRLYCRPYRMYPRENAILIRESAIRKFKFSHSCIGAVPYDPRYPQVSAKVPYSTRTDSRPAAYLY